jgi:hypothetical protein
MTLYSALTSSLTRHFPLVPALEEISLRRSEPPLIEAALNEQFSFQVALRLVSEDPQRVHIHVEAPDGWSVRVRYEGLVPVRHHNTPVIQDSADMDGLGQIPGYVPDPLFDEDSAYLSAEETRAFWITIRPGPDAIPGQHQLRVVLTPERGEEIVHLCRVCLHDIVLQKRTDFNITHWFYVDALIDWYKTDLFDERFWEILPKYVRDVVEHGQDTLYVPVFTPPLDGVKRPSQLLRVERTGMDGYAFDWRDVKRYIDLAKERGIGHLEWCHLFTQWGAQNAIRVYEGQGREGRLLWPPDTEATSDVYRTFLAQFLPELYRFLEDEEILDRSFFHVSDEPHGEGHLANYRGARAMLRELAPWMRVMDALSDIEFARHGLIDMPIPSIRTALEFVAEGIPSWCYYCCGPRGNYLNRLLDTPLPKIAMHGLLFYRWPLHGFLHWGYNYWYQSQTRTLIDPYTVQDGLAWERGWAYGDTFVVYPGRDGPVDSIRWEIFGESLQDYALLQTLGIDRSHPLLAPIVSFRNFPKTQAWRRSVRRKLLCEAAERGT